MSEPHPPWNEELDAALREALAPLDRDPAHVAEDVLAQIPHAPVSPGPNLLPPLSWWLASGGLCAGLALGWWLRGPAPEPQAPPPPVSTTSNNVTTPQPTDIAPPQPNPTGTAFKDEKPSEKPSIEARMLGPITLHEPDFPPEELLSGGYIVATGSRFTTEESLVGGMLRPQGVLFRFDRATDGTVGPGSQLALHAGRAWVATDLRADRVVLETATGRFAVESGSMMVELDGTTTTVWCLEGTVQLTTAERQSALLQKGERTTISDGMCAAAETPFVGTATSWMTPFIVLQMDATERENRAEDMVTALADPNHRDAASHELRKLGPASIPPLMRAMRNPNDPALQLVMLRLVDQAADFATARGLVPWLMVDDERVRRALFDTLVRVTGMDRGTSHTFWSTASREEREQVIEEWRAALR